MSQEFEGFPSIDYENGEGFTRIPNLYFEVAAKLTPAESLVLLAIMRKTYGWHKRSDRISLSQFREATGLGKTAILKAIKALELRGLIVVKRDERKGVGIDRETNLYGVKFAPKAI